MVRATLDEQAAQEEEVADNWGNLDSDSESEDGYETEFDPDDTDAEDGEDDVLLEGHPRQRRLHGSRAGESEWCSRHSSKRSVPRVQGESRREKGERHSLDPPGRQRSTARGIVGEPKELQQRPNSARTCLGLLLVCFRLRGYCLALL